MNTKVAFIKYWTMFQFGPAWLKFFQDIFDWLTTKDNKRRGLDVSGEPNSGKSYVLQALLALIGLVGYIRPTKGYPFNWDIAYNKLIVCAEECYIAPDDYATIETLKDVLSGNPSPIRLKNEMTVTMNGTTPFVFISNNDNFNRNDTSNNNPFNTRLCSKYLRNLRMISKIYLPHKTY